MEQFASFQVTELQVPPWLKVNAPCYNVVFPPTTRDVHLRSTARLDDSSNHVNDKSLAGKLIDSGKRL